MVQEFVKYGALDLYLKRSNVSLSWKLDVAKQLACTLNFLVRERLKTHGHPEQSFINTVLLCFNWSEALTVVQGQVNALGVTVYLIRCCDGGGDVLTFCNSTRIYDIITTPL